MGVDNKPAFMNFRDMFDDPAADADFIWSSNLVLDNLVLMRRTVERRQRPRDLAVALPRFSVQCTRVHTNRSVPGLVELLKCDGRSPRYENQFSALRGRAMQGMIFGDPPEFEAVLKSISALETRLNRNGASGSDASPVKSTNVTRR